MTADSSFPKPARRARRFFPHTLALALLGLGACDSFTSDPEKECHTGWAGCPCAAERSCPMREFFPI